jgi:hypothetical protein
MKYLKRFTAYVQTRGNVVKWHTEARDKRTARGIFENRADRSDGSRTVLKVKEDTPLTPTRYGLSPLHNQ